MKISDLSVSAESLGGSVEARIPEDATSVPGPWDLCTQKGIHRHTDTQFGSGGMSFGRATDKRQGVTGLARGPALLLRCFSGPLRRL